jgi:uncharacterized protein (DUF362 family)
MPVSVVRAENYEQESVQNALYRAFSLLGLDPENPFREIIKPGDTVFIKPNWVAHRYRASCPKQHGLYTTITHPAVIREVSRHVDRALGGDGEIIIGDNPSIDADFDALMREQALDSLTDELQTPLSLLDLRPLACTDLKDYGERDRMAEKSGDPKGETIVNLGKESMLYGLNPSLFRGVFNQREETIKAHSGETLLYGFSNSIYKADVFISIPKLKTHHKVGTTLNLKGLVGTVGTKNYLVHWREGFPLIGGDAYPGFWHWLKDQFSPVKNRGAWNGNDTIWRMVVDLYTGIQRGPKKFFTVIDGILGGEGDGPFCPEPNESKVLLAGTNFLEADIVASRLMGFKVEEITYLNYFLKNGFIDKKFIEVFSDFLDKTEIFDDRKCHFGYKVPTHWQNLTGG